MKQKRKVKSLSSSSCCRTFSGNDLIASLLLVLGGVLLLGSVSLFSMHGVDAASLKTQYYTGVTNKTETIYGVTFLDDKNRDVVGDMYVDKGSNGSDFYIKTNSVVAGEVNNGIILTESDKVGRDTSSSVLGGNIHSLQSANITLIGGNASDVSMGNNNAAMLGGSEIEIGQGSSYVPLAVIGGSKNKIEGDQNGNSLVGGSDNNIGSNNTNVHVLGGQNNEVAGNNTNVIVAGGGIHVDSNVNNVFAFSAEGTTFSPKSSNTFYLDVPNGLGLDKDTDDGKVSSNGAVSMGELTPEDLKGCRYNPDGFTYVSENIGVQGTISGCLVGCTSKSVEDSKWELLDKSEKCVDVCESSYDCTVYPDTDGTKGGEDHQNAYCTGIDVKDSWWNGRVSQCGGDGAETKYEDVVFKTEIIDVDGTCPGDQNPKGENQCTFKCNPGYHLVDGMCYKDCTRDGHTIKHGESDYWYKSTEVTCGPNSCETTPNNKKLLTCDDGNLGDENYLYHEEGSKCITKANTCSKGENIFDWDISKTDIHATCTESCREYNVKSNECSLSKIYYECSCPENSTLMSDGHCEPNTRSSECSSLPSNADAVISTFTQTWDRSKRDPQSKEYDASNTSECTFKCKENYIGNGNACTAGTQAGSCAESSLPGNAESLISTFVQTWDGSAWMPVSKEYDVLNTSECTFKCVDGYHWDSGACVENGQMGDCSESSLPSNAEPIISTFPQTWTNYNGAWLYMPVTKDYSSSNTTADGCTFKCASGYYWDGSSCLNICRSAGDGCDGSYTPSGTNQSTSYTCTQGGNSVSCSCPMGYEWSTKLGKCMNAGNVTKQCGYEVGDNNSYSCYGDDVSAENKKFLNNVYTWDCVDALGYKKSCSLEGGVLCPSSTSCDLIGKCQGGGTPKSYGYTTGSTSGSTSHGGFDRLLIDKDGNPLVGSDFINIYESGDTSKWTCVNGDYIEQCSVTCPGCKKSIPDHAHKNNDLVPSTSTDWSHSEGSSAACTFSCDDGYDWVKNAYTNSYECKDVDHYEWRFEKSDGSSISELRWTVGTHGHDYNARAQIFGAYFSRENAHTDFVETKAGGGSDDGGDWANYNYTNSINLTAGKCSQWGWLNGGNKWRNIEGSSNISSFTNSDFYSVYDGSDSYSKYVKINLKNFYNNGIPIIQGANHPGFSLTSTYKLFQGRRIDLTFSSSQPSVSRVKANGSSKNLYGYMIWGGTWAGITSTYEACVYAIEPIDWEDIVAVSTPIYYARCGNLEHGDSTSKYENSCTVSYRCNNGTLKELSRDCSSNSNPGVGQNCFLAGTQVLMEDGETKNIENVELGDVVLSYNPETKKNEYNIVNKKFIHENVDDELYELTINGEVLKTTYAHRFYVVRGLNNGYQCKASDEWIAAAKLREGDILLMNDGRHVKIEKIEHYPYHGTMYNLGVENVNNYYVDKGYLVHNSQMNERMTDLKDNVNTKDFAEENRNL